jgi:hypothetical protein
MSALSDVLQRPAKALKSARTKPQAPAAPVKPEPTPEEDAELLAQRDRLLEKFTVMQADLGGAFYEMAIRDHVRMDVLTRKAAELRRADAAGICPNCDSPYGPADRFCPQCGQSLVTAVAS